MIALPPLACATCGRPLSRLQWVTLRGYSYWRCLLCDGPSVFRAVREEAE
jgi:hypothetical protein